MRRNIHSTNDIVRSNHERLLCNEQTNKIVIEMLKDIKEEMRQYNFHIKMETADVGKYFPLDCDEDLQEFMDRGHPEWPSRMKGFYHLLFTTVTQKKRRFGGALLHALFTRNFISCHRWPFPGYVKLISQYCHHLLFRSSRPLTLKLQCIFFIKFTNWFCSLAHAKNKCALILRKSAINF